MYLKFLELENFGPIDSLKFSFPFSEGKPKPVVLVGGNGAGKSVILAQIVNSLLLAKQEVFDDVEVEKGRVFKYRNPTYIKGASHYYYSKVLFDNGAEVREWQLRMTRKQFEDNLQYTPVRREWTDILESEISSLNISFHNKKTEVEGLFDKRCCLYFPVNRFEEPSWLNLENLKVKVSFSDLKNLSGYSNRNVICSSPLKENMNWLLDLVLDMRAFDMMTVSARAELISEGGEKYFQNGELIVGYKGKSFLLYNIISQVLKIILRDNGNIRLGVGPRGSRVISVEKDESTWIPNLFHMSTGETQILNLFLSILRDYDLSGGPLAPDLSDLTGIVVIDEIDSHLHTVLQEEVLPDFIGYFPKIQFVITTHSPLFLVGMEKKFGEDGFYICSLPSGERVAASDFSEFEAAYNSFKETKRYKDELARELHKQMMPVVFVEGEYDISYIKKAAEALGKQDTIGKIQLKDAGGFGGLDRLWKAYDNVSSTALPSKVLLIYDCDTKKTNAEKNLIYKRVIPSIPDHPIERGIENLFPSSTIQKLEEKNTDFVDLQEASTVRERGKVIKIPERRSINRDEKKNVCVWLCSNGDSNDFSHFSVVFDIIDGIFK